MVWMSFEGIIPSEISQLQMTNIMWFHLHEIPRGVKLIKIESGMWTDGVMGTKFQSEMMMSSVKMMVVQVKRTSVPGLHTS
jgi:hypothetical protein